METHLDATLLASGIKTAKVMTTSARLQLDNVRPISTAAYKDWSCDSRVTPFLF